jgi:hypothetical protein
MRMSETPEIPLAPEARPLGEWLGGGSIVAQLTSEEEMTVTASDAGI